MHASQLPLCFRCVIIICVNGKKLVRIANSERPGKIALLKAAECADTRNLQQLMSVQLSFSAVTLSGGCHVTHDFGQTVPP
jgi:hypothetical protein